jgi:hypothetical protein
MSLLKTIAFGILKQLPALVLNIALAPIKEMFEEIIRDGFLEAFAEGIVGVIGGNDELAFWLSTYLTSVREAHGPIGNLITGRKSDADTDTEIDNRQYAAYYKAKRSGDMDAAFEIRQEIESKLQLQKQQQQQELENRKAWQMLLKSSMFKGALMLIPALFTGGLGIFALNSMFKGMKDIPSISKTAMVNHRTRTQALRKVKDIPSLSAESMFAGNLAHQLKKPSDLDGADLNALFRGEQTDSKADPPITIQFPDVSINPKTLIQFNLASKFDAVAKRTAYIDPKMPIPTSSTYSNFMTFGFGFDEDPLGEVEKAMNRRIIEATATKKQLQQYDDWNEFFDWDDKDRDDYHNLYSIPLSPEKETTIRDFLTEDLSLSDRVLTYDVFVNGEKIDAEFWYDYEITPQDKLHISSDFGFLKSQIQPIEDKILTEGKKNIDDQVRCRDLLTPQEYEIMYNYLFKTQDNLFDKANFDSSLKVASKNTPYFKFLIDESLSILEEFDIVRNADHKQFSKIVRWRTDPKAEAYLKVRFYEMRRGAVFGITEDYLNKWYVGMWYEIQTAQTSEQNKESALSHLDRLILPLYNVFIDKNEVKQLENPAYLKIKLQFLKYMITIVKETNLMTQSDQSQFINLYINPHFSDYTDYDPLPHHARDSYINLYDSIKSSLTNPSDELLKKLDLIHLETMDIINSYQNSVYKYILDKYAPSAKRDLIINILDCPYTNVLRSLETVQDLSYFLISYERNHQIETPYTYLGNTLMRGANFQPFIIEDLLTRVNELKIEDFERINDIEKTLGLDREVDEYELKILKRWVKHCVYRHNRKFNKVNYNSIDTTYYTKGHIDLLEETFHYLWRSAAYHKNDITIFYYNLRDIYSFWVDGPFVIYVGRQINVFGKTLIGRCIDMINSFITSLDLSRDLISDEEYLRKMDTYVHTKCLLKMLDKRTVRLKTTWSRRPYVAQNWFDRLFIPSTSYHDYTYGFISDPNYRAWAITMNMADLFSTGLSFDPIPDEAFLGDLSISYALHHLDPTQKMSMALDDQVLTWRKYHNILESLSVPDALYIKKNLRNLLHYAIEKKDSQAQNYPGKTYKKWITKQDFEKFFPPTMMFTISKGGTKYTDNWYHILEIVLNEDYDFDGKIEIMNMKIQDFKDAVERGENGYLAVMKESNPIATELYLETAVAFVDSVWILMQRGAFGIHTFSELVDDWYYFLNNDFLRNAYFPI